MQKFQVSRTQMFFDFKWLFFFIFQWIIQSVWKAREKNQIIIYYSCVPEDGFDYAKKIYVDSGMKVNHKSTVSISKYIF